jgi:Flp pilus assembly protein TadG
MAAMKSNRRIRSERGAELIEFALVFPLLLFVVLGLVDFGFLFQRMEVVTNGAREGARIAVLPGYNNADVKARVLSYLNAGGVATTATNPTVTCDGCDPATPFTIAMPAPTAAMSGKRVRVVYTYQYLFIGSFVGFFGGSFGTVPITGVAVMRDEIPAS